MKLADAEHMLTLGSEFNLWVRAVCFLYPLLMFEENPLNTNEVRTERNRTAAFFGSDPFTSSRRDLSIVFKEYGEVDKDG